VADVSLAPAMQQCRGQEEREKLAEKVWPCLLAG
jgi:hypothetical protein